MKRVLLMLLAGATVFAADAPRIVYTKSFPGSTPAYVGITVERSGAATYKETPDDDPETLQLEDSAAAAIFDLAGKLDHFKHPLESGLKIANMGEKTFRWEDGSESSEAKFNYSLDMNARALQDWFERITESERAFVKFRFAVKHDRLGVEDSLLQIQSLWDQKRLVGTAQFLPLFDRVAKDGSYIHMAQERAATLAGAIRTMEQAKAQ
ncbi:MAG TPA: hypothetical protein VFW83_01810 [Bryobacteraceae bacterium]|nr:hypothetical protein [Bryobacteraceae bacterium]